ncbi:anti-sigma F factor [Anaerovoracaceae bacterium 42-11]|nr:anti-sigma F factor [Emergencia sp.]
MESNFVTIEFEALPQNQGFARAVAASYAAPLDPTVEELTEIKTAVSEAVSNAVIHGYERKGAGKIVMEFKTIDKDKIFIKITDFGKGISDIPKAMEPMFSTEEEREMSGMGFTVMESFTDKVFVESEPGRGTAVTLIKYLDVYHGV